MDLITTVGTSLVTNVINKIRNNPNCNEDEQKALNFYSLIQREGYENRDKFIDEYNFLKSFILSNIDFSEKVSAEIKSIINIKNHQKFKNVAFVVQPIMTDTILSPLCAEILKF
jgi:hypothetical protein